MGKQAELLSENHLSELPVENCICLSFTFCVMRSCDLVLLVSVQYGGLSMTPLALLGFLSVNYLLVGLSPEFHYFPRSRGVCKHLETYLSLSF